MAHFILISTTIFSIKLNDVIKRTSTCKPYEKQTHFFLIKYICSNADKWSSRVIAPEQITFNLHIQYHKHTMSINHTKLCKCISASINSVINNAMLFVCNIESLNMTYLHGVLWTIELLRPTKSPNIQGTYRVRI